MLLADNGGGYLVAQVGDTVRVDLPGSLFGTFGEVIASRDTAEPPSVTARFCTVRSDGGSEVEVHADHLRVLR